MPVIHGSCIVYCTTNCQQCISKHKHASFNSSSYLWQVVTHQHSTIKRACDRLIFLHEGRVVWEGSVSEFDTSDEPIVRQFASGSLHGPMKYK